MYDHTFADIFRQFFWLIFPIMGMGMGAFSIWNEFSRQKKALEVLKVYAEKGQEPPESVLQILGRASVKTRRNRNSSWAGAAFAGVMAVGFAGLAIWTDVTTGGFPFVMGWSIAAIALGAICASNVVGALTRRPDDE
jgi:hypothetical protein